MPDHLRGQPTHFNSQPHKEADCFHGLPSFSLSHFNSQPHKEADVYFFFVVQSADISTHSLTRRLTSAPDIPDTTLLFQLTASQGG